MTTYTRAELEQKRDKLRKAIKHLDIQSQTDRLEGRLDNLSFQLIRNELNHMSTEVYALDTQLVMMTIDSIAIGPNNPGAHLDAAIQGLEAAASRLDDLHEMLMATAEVINVLTSITIELMRRLVLPIR